LSEDRVRLRSFARLLKSRKECVPSREGRGGPSWVIREHSVATSASGTDLPVFKSLTSMPGIVRGADQDFDVPNGLAIDRPWTHACPEQLRRASHAIERPVVFPDIACNLDECGDCAEPQPHHLGQTDLSYIGPSGLIR